MSTFGFEARLPSPGRRCGMDRPRAASLASALILAATTTTAAQSQAPPHWQVVPDSSGQVADTVAFTMMPPGWHITTGPASLIFDPRRLLEDRFTLTTELFLFPESSHEGFGLFIGGDQLGGADARYVALQLRRDGSAAVLQRQGESTTLLSEWTPIDAVGPHPGEGTQRITMRIEVDSANVSFAANDAEIARLPRSGLELAGRFGFRIGNGVNLHVTRLDVTEQLAPPARP
ncbi:MAG: hypothetical protein ACREM1_02925 [Longimicrobiales bacterium]